MGNNEVKQFKAKVVWCKCSENGERIKFTKIPSRYGVNYITLGCMACGTQTRLFKTAYVAVNLWNEHFGKRARKVEESWDFDAEWEQFL